MSLLKKMTTIATHGFLSDESDRSIRDFGIRYAQICSAYRLLGEFAHRAKFEFRGGRRNEQQILVALLFGRALTEYEAIFLLASRGMEQPYQAVLRMLLETMSYALHADSHAENAKAIILAADCEEKSISDALLKVNKKANPAGDHSVDEIFVRDSGNSINKSGAKKLYKRDIIAKNDLSTGIYEIGYLTLCRSAHPDAKRLQEALKIGADGSVNKIDWGQQYVSVELELALAMDCLIRVLGCKALGVPETMIPELQSVKTQIEQIHHRLNDDQERQNSSP